MTHNEFNKTRPPQLLRQTADFIEKCCGGDTVFAEQGGESHCDERRRQDA